MQVNGFLAGALRNRQTMVFTARHPKSLPPVACTQPGDCCSQIGAACHRHQMTHWMNRLVAESQQFEAVLQFWHQKQLACTPAAGENGSWFGESACLTSNC